MKYNELKIYNPQYSVGIDQSIRSTGLTILNHNSEVVYSSIISSNTDSSSEDRIIMIVQNILGTIKRTCDSSIQVVIEGPSYARNANFNNGVLLYGLFMNILTSLRLENIPYIITPPTSLKLFATQNGRAKKDEMIDNIETDIKNVLSNLSNVKMESKKFEDIADSYWLAKYGMQDI